MRSTHETLTDLMLDELLTEGKSRVKCCCSFRHRPILLRRYSSPDDSPPNSLREQPHDDLEVQGVGPNGKFPHVRPLQFKSSTKAALCSTRTNVLGCNVVLYYKEPRAAQEDQLARVFSSKIRIRRIKPRVGPDSKGCFKWPRTLVHGVWKSQ